MNTGKSLLRCCKIAEVRDKISTGKRYSLEQKIDSVAESWIFVGRSFWFGVMVQQEALK